MANGRRMMHGGKSPWGREHPSFKTGLRSKYRIECVVQFLTENPGEAELLEGVDLETIDDEIRFASALLGLYIRNQPRDNMGEWYVRAARLVDRIGLLKYRRIKMLKKQAKITLQELEDIVRRFTILSLEGIKKLVKDEKTKNRLFAYFQTIPEQVVDSLSSP